MPRPKADTWSIKKIIKKSKDVDLNTAIALSKSLLEEQKEKKKRAKNADLTPYHLMLDSKEVQNRLMHRLNDAILQPFNIKLINVDLSGENRIWDKTSLDSGMKAGELSYNDINMSELMEYYVPALMPPIIPSTVRMGDKIMSMSLIEGREKSFLFCKKENKREMKQSSMDIDNCKDSCSKSCDKGISTQSHKTEGVAEMVISQTSDTNDIQLSHSNEARYSNDGQLWVAGDAQPSYLNDIQPPYLNDVQPSYLNDIQPSYLNDVQPSYLNDIQPLYPNEARSSYSNEAILSYSNDIPPLYLNNSKSPYSNDALTADSNVSKTPEFDIHLRMFNNSKHSDLIVLLKSNDVLYLHKFILSAWMCDDDLLRSFSENSTHNIIPISSNDSQHFISDINDEIVIKFFKHLYCYGNFNIDDIIDGVDCLKLCQMFGLKHSSLKRHTNISVVSQPSHKTNDFPVSSNSSIFPQQSQPESQILFSSPSKPSPNDDLILDKNDEIVVNGISHNFDLPEDLKELNKFSNELVQSTPIFVHHQSTFASLKTEEKLCQSNFPKHSSIENLFESVTQTSLGSGESLSSSGPLETDHKNDTSAFELHEKICLFTNETFCTAPDEIELKPVIGPSLEYPIDTPFTQNSPISHNVSYNHYTDTDLIQVKMSSSFKDISTEETNNADHMENFTINPSYGSENISNNFIALKTCPENEKPPSIKTEDIYNPIFYSPVNKATKIDLSSPNSLVKHSPLSFDDSDVNLSFFSPPVSLKKSFSSSDAGKCFLSLDSPPTKLSLENDSPLPLFQRMGLKSKIFGAKGPVLNVSSGEETVKEKSPIINVTKKSRQSTRRISKKEKEKPVQEPEKQNNVEKKKVEKPQKPKATKRKSSDKKIDCETPSKQKMPPFNPFTPMPDFRHMAVADLEKRCVMYGLKPKLSKTKYIKFLEELHLYTRQVDDGRDLDDSSDSTQQSYGEVFSDLEGEDVSDNNLDDNEAVFQFLRTNYFKDILIYKPLDIVKVLSELKEIGIVTTFAKLQDYFDNQCILTVKKDDNNKDSKYKRSARPLKAAHMIL